MSISDFNFNCLVIEVDFCPQFVCDCIEKIDSAISSVARSVFKSQESDQGQAWRLFKQNHLELIEKTHRNRIKRGWQQELHKLHFEFFEDTHRNWIEDVRQQELKILRHQKGEDAIKHWEQFYAEPSNKRDSGKSGKHVNLPLDISWCSSSDSLDSKGE